MSMDEGIKGFMTSKIISIDEVAKITEAIKKMVDHNIGSIVVKRDMSMWAS